MLLLLQAGVAGGDEGGGGDATAPSGTPIGRNALLLLQRPVPPLTPRGHYER